MGIYPDTPEKWREMPVELNDSELRIGDWQVMQAWEEPLMEALAREATARGGDILEVGYGMGISAEKILAHGCRSYTVIEIHPVIAEAARSWAAKQDVPCTVLEGAWQDVVPTLAANFDGILFDTYPLSAEERGKNHFPFIEIAPTLLRENGLFVCYSDDTVSFRTEHLELLLTHFDEVKLVKVTDLQPVEGCEYWSESHMVIPVARHRASDSPLVAAP